METILEKFAGELKATYGTNMLSLVLYGSKASGEDTPGHSDYNILVILETVSFAHLQVDGILTKWIRKGNPPPLVFSKELFLNSSDIFPIEFLDMKDKHKILYGEDPFTDLVVDLKHLRHQCEFEMTGKLLKLRQSFMPIAGEPKKVRQLLVGSLSSFLVVFRHILRLYGKVLPVTKMETLRELAHCIDFNPAVFETVQRMKQEDRDALKLDPETVMEEYLAQVEKIAMAVDKVTH